MFRDIPIKALIPYSVEIYPIFSNKLSQNDFINLFQSLPEEKANDFFRACNSYIQSQKCLTCDPENTSSLALSILCTAIETISQNSKKIPYHDWLWKKKLDELENILKEDLKNKLQEAHLEYLKSPLRTGRRYDYSCFLMEYGQSKEMEVSPIKRTQKGEQVFRPLSFEDTVNRIYEKYRSRFMHESLRKIDIPTRISKLDGIHLLEPEKKGTYDTDVKNLPIWFSKIVKESLYNYLISTHPPSSDGELGG